MRPLLPTLKEKKRYVRYRVISARPLERDVGGEVLRSLHDTLGVFGAAEAGLLSVSYDVRSQTGIIRCSLAALEKVKASLLMAGYLGRTRVVIRTLRVSGILAKARMEE